MNKHIWVKFLPDSFVKGAATLGPLGFWGKAPGTVGSIAGIVWFVLLYWNISLFGFIILTAPLVYFAIQICWEAEDRMGLRDPGIIILDEFVAIPFCFIGLVPWLHTPIGWMIVLAGFGLFRLFDILKPFGIKKLQDMPGGVGVVVDDLAAGAATCVTLHVGLALVVRSGLLG